jgi:hypothetical protein
VGRRERGVIKACCFYTTRDPTACRVFGCTIAQNAL